LAYCYLFVQISAGNLFPLAVICTGQAVEMDKPHILAKAAETGFLQFIEQVPLNVKYRTGNKMVVYLGISTWFPQ
jgi:hypothetical protein